jgi:broad specificity phosphatase PhoE
LNESDEALVITWADFQFSFPKGETNYEAQSRVISTLSELSESHESSHIAIGTHDVLLALILKYHDPKISFDFWHSLEMLDIFVLEVGGDHARYSRTEMRST